MKNEQGPEDKPNWRKSNVVPATTCGVCKGKIEARHCDNVGCNWCATCGEKAKLTPKKDK